MGVFALDVAVEIVEVVLVDRDRDDAVEAALQWADHARRHVEDRFAGLPSHDGTRNVRKLLVAGLQDFEIVPVGEVQLLVGRVVQAVGA